MSLVLNTNLSGGGWYEISNDFLDIYPDIKNKILFSFWNWLAFSSTAITSWNYVAEINWTKINYRWTSIVAPEYYTSVNWNDQWPVYFWNTVVSTWTFQKRFWLPTKMNWWEIIWKEIIWWFLWVFWYSYFMDWWTFSQKVWLLHTDWTITYIWELSYTITSVWYWERTYFNTVRENGGSIQSCLYPTSRTWWNRIIWNWVVAQEWDLIICDLTLWITHINASWWTQYTTWIFFWYNFTTVDNFRNIPLQISID